MLVYQRVRDKSSLQMASAHEYSIAMLKKIGGIGLLDTKRVSRNGSAVMIHALISETRQPE